MSPVFANFKLLPAMQQSGCPICRIRNYYERDYLTNLLKERVNDGETRNHVNASFGFCPKHTWQMGCLDLTTYGEPVKNSMVYEFLVMSVLVQLRRYQSVERTRENRIVGWFRRLFQKKPPFPFKQEPFASLVVKSCYVCEIGNHQEAHFLRALLAGFGVADDDLRAAYQSSDGLCFDHFRKAFADHDETLSESLDFLVAETIKKMDALGLGLTGYIDKHGLGYSEEPVTMNERTSWSRAIRFFGKHDEYFLPGYSEPEQPERPTAYEELRQLLNANDQRQAIPIEKRNL